MKEPATEHPSDSARFARSFASLLWRDGMVSLKAQMYYGPEEITVKKQRRRRARMTAIRVPSNSLGHRPSILEPLRGKTVGVHGRGLFEKNVSWLMMWKSLQYCSRQSSGRRDCTFDRRKSCRPFPLPRVDCSRKKALLFPFGEELSSCSALLVESRRHRQLQPSRVRTIVSGQAWAEQHCSCLQTIPLVSRSVWG